MVTKNNIDFGYTYKQEDGQSIRMRTVRVCDEIDRLAGEIIRLEAEIKQLEAQGMTDAKIYWARKDDPQGKPDQLELTHSTNSPYFLQNNTRREYIGVKQDKINEALERVKRFKWHAARNKELRDLVAKIQAAERVLRTLEQAVFSKQGHLFY